MVARVYGLGGARAVNDRPYVSCRVWGVRAGARNDGGVVPYGFRDC